MADDLSLLFRIRGDAAGAKAATAETRAAVAQLRSQLGSEFGAIQKAGESAFQNLGNSLNVFVGQRIPLVGGAFIRVSENLRNLGGDSKKAEQELAGLTKTIEGISASTGKSTQSVTAFLTSFVQLETQAKRDAAAIETFGAATAQTLIPELEKAGEQMATVATTAETTGAGIGAMAGPIGIAVIAAAALAAGAALLVKELFDLSIASADFQGKMFDLSQQTGVSVETLSALEVVAKTTGGNIESMTASLGIFQKHLEEAQDPTSKASALFEKLGVDTSDTETALRETIKALAEMPEGFEQTSAALEVFGRGGKAFLAIAKESNGNLDELTDKLKDLGIIISTEDAKAADEFNDQLALLGFQARALGATLVKDVIPQLLSAFQALSRIIKDNREAINLTGTAIGIFAEGAVRTVAPAMRILIGVLDSVRYAFAGVQFAALTAMGVSMDAAATIASVGRSSGSGFEGVSGSAGGVNPFARLSGVAGGVAPSKGGGGGGGSKAVDDFAEFIKKQELAIKEATETADKYTKEIDKLAEALQKKGKAFTDSMRAEVEANAATLRAIDKETERRKKLAELQAETDKWLRQIVQDTNDAAEGTDQYDKKLRELVAAASAVGLTFDDNTLKLIALNVQLARAPELVEQFDKMLDKFNQDLQINRDIVSGLPDKYRPFLEVLRETEEKNRKFTEKTDATIGAPPPEMVLKQKVNPSAIAQLGAAADKINESLNPGTFAAAQAGVDALTTSFGALGGALGNVVQAFVLYGNAGTSVRKITAEILASVAQQAAVKAVFELAEGFAALALAYFGIPNAGPSAHAHFVAAAVYGSIAGIAAVTGRVVAGNAFAQGGSASGGGSGGGSGSSGGSSRANGGSSPIVMGSQRGPDVMHLMVSHSFKKDGTLESHIDSAIVKSASGNGTLRTVIVKEIKRQE